MSKRLIKNIFYALSLPNIYKSTAILAMADKDNSLNSITKQYKSLTSLQGLNIGNDYSSQKDEALQRMKSFKFFERNILSKINKQDLMAVESWNRNTNTLNYNPKEYDFINNSWTRKVNYPKTQIPSSQEIHEYILKNNLSISIDNQTSLVSVSFLHFSPYLATYYVNLYVNGINKEYQMEDKSISSNRIEFLQDSINNNKLADVSLVLASLLEKEVQNLMLIEGDDTYIFNIVDEPYAPELKFKPVRAVICVLITLFGGLISLVYVLLTSNIQSRSNN